MRHIIGFWGEKKILSKEKVQNAIIERCGPLVRSKMAANYPEYLFISF